jgi:hypothetical protein
MGATRNFWLSGALGGLLAGGVACVDRERPFELGPGNGSGPQATVTFPAELASVPLDSFFFLDVRLTDPDGIDSVWTWLEPNINTLTRFGGDGDTSKTVGYTIVTPPNFPEETLTVHVQGLDVLGDSGPVFTRKLLIQ